MSLSSIFSQPLLIYDDKCSSCTKFAKSVSIVSKGWIRTAGHYYSTEADEARKLVFPSGYNATKMFWLINSHGAYGARSGLIPVIKEIILVNIGKRKIKNCNQNQDEYRITCDYSRELSCMSTKSTLKRFIGMMLHGTRFYFNS
jgi:hypothetical protein